MNEFELENNENTLENEVQDTQDVIAEIALHQIVANRYQPRQVFDEYELQELAESIKVHGLLQPIALRKVTNDMYEIIAGERRYRATKLLGLPTIQAIVKNVASTDAAVLALVENLQREDLSPIEEAKSYAQLMELYNCTQQEIATKVGISQSAVANKLRLLQLTAEVQSAIEQHVITERHGRALLKVKNQLQQNQLLQWIIKNKLTVAETEKYVARFLDNEQRKIEKQPVIRSVAKDTKLAVNTIHKAVKTIEEFGMNVGVEQVENEDSYTMIINIPKKFVETAPTAKILPHEKEENTTIDNLQQLIAEQKQENNDLPNGTLSTTQNEKQIDVAAKTDTKPIVLDLDLTSETIFFKPEDDFGE